MNGFSAKAAGKQRRRGRSKLRPYNLKKEPTRKNGVWGTRIEQRGYSKWIRTISGAVQTRRGGPQVPAPLEV
jgi:hypothetical protein